jgi:hypothetical protein
VTGPGDILARAVYRFPGYLGASDSRLGGDGLWVTQEYRFRGDDDQKCEPTGEMDPCGRFWPTLSYEYKPPPACDRTSGATCSAFNGLRSVQRIEFRPENAAGGAINAFKDVPGTGGNGWVAGVQTKGDRAMKYEDVDNAIRDGKTGDWDSIHVSPSNETTFPGTNVFSLHPGCGECAHMHWTWRKITNGIVGRINPLNKDFTDGNPQIRQGSTQTADFGIIRNQPGEEDPVATGWRSLVNEKGSEDSKLIGYDSVVFWEMTSFAGSDSTFPLLDNYKHGGNGALFFGGEHHH